MNPADRARARYHTYLLLSHLYTSGVTADLLPYIKEIPQLSAASPQIFNADEEAAAYNLVFANNIVPYESLFRSSQGLLGGIHAEDVESCYRSAGINFRNGEDNISHELAFMAALSKALALALSSADAVQAKQVEELQNAFLRDHLLRWLPPFKVSLSFSGQPFYRALGELTLEVIHDHWMSLEPDRPCILNPDDFDHGLPQLEVLLAQENTNLKEIAKFLVTPSRSGFFLGQVLVAKLARNNDLPRGFGNRRQVLANLFHSAAQYDRVPNLLHDIEIECGEWIQQYEQQIEAFPIIEPYVKTWLQRIMLTANAIATMKDQFVESALSSD